MFACHRVIDGIVETLNTTSLHHLVEILELFLIINLLFYDCFNSRFAFDSYSYITCRSSDCNFVGSKNCVGNGLTKYVADSNFLALCTLNDYSTISCYYADCRSTDSFVLCRSCSIFKVKCERSSLVDTFVDCIIRTFMVTVLVCFLS